MQDKDIKNSTFIQLFKPALSQDLWYAKQVLFVWQGESPC